VFKKILIANRGEIACRVIQTLRKLGIASVAVYSDADKNARHTSMADEAVCIGAAPSAHSYLAIDHLLQACHDTGADAVHPGYGFLSENVQFATRLRNEGFVFIGPGERALATMGDKLASKRLARETGVNTIAGPDEIVSNADDAVRIARDVGYPVMLKASAGGGGKAMRIARNDGECRDGYERATNEAQSSFGDNRLLVEKFVERPRHIEIQIFGDSHGNVIHLGERECSLQRRHQKILEESPSPFVDEPLRTAMGAQAVALAQAVDYQSAGTVEFLVDDERNFYFLEMNTRLQVEHPVTELVTGIDLVEWMIRIAAGEALPWSQKEIALDGWAIEARVYAEDPARGFLPSAGRLIRFVPPVESNDVRVDTGVREGDEISIHYDPMIAKLITHGATRDVAIDRMRDALDEFCIRGIAHNVGFLGALVGHGRMIVGDLSTDLVDKEHPHGFDATETAQDDPALLLAVGGVVHRRVQEQAARISDQLAGYEAVVKNDWVVVTEEEQSTISVQPTDGGYRVHCGGSQYRVTTDWQIGQLLFRATMNDTNNDTKFCVQVERRQLGYRLSHRGAEVDLMVLSARAAELLSRIPANEPPDTHNYLLSPMPGLLTAVLVEVGDDVKIGQDLVIVEAMKMENVLRAERAGKVANLLVSAGTTLVVDQPILEFE